MSKTGITQGNMLFERFQISHRLGKGSFGEVYAACDLDNHGNSVAIKIEKNALGDSSVLWEKQVYDRMWSKRIPIGIPRPIKFIRFGRSDLLVLPLLGKSLRDIWVKNGRFSLPSISMIGIQILNRLEHIHNLGMLHMDIKPENLLIGRGGDSKTVYLVDYGLSFRYTDRNGIHKPYSEDTDFLGTPAFSSVHMDVCTEHSPRDDLESMMYTLLILHRGRLPWCRGDWADPNSFPEDFEEVKWESRETIFNKMPREYQRAWNIVCKMDFGDAPRYDRLRGLFAEAAKKSYEDDGLYFGTE